MEKNNNRKKLLTLGVVLVLAAVIYGCWEKASEDSAVEMIQRPVRIGFSMDSMVVERWSRDRDYFVQYAQGLGAEVIVKDALADPEKQILDIRELVEAEVDVLVVIPLDAGNLKGTIDSAVIQGIPVIAYDRLILDSDISYYLSFDNVQVGEMMAQMALQADPQGRWLIVNGGANDRNSFMINQGIKTYLGQQDSEIQPDIVHEIWPPDWTDAYVKREFLAYLKSHTVPSTIIAANDLFAGTLIRILAQERLAGKVYVLGQDADLAACQRLYEGTQYATIYKPLKNLARQAASLAVSLGRGIYPQAIRSINNGKKEVPFFALEPIGVTRDNLSQTVIADGFHSEEAVFGK